MKGKAGYCSTTMVLPVVMEDVVKSEVVTGMAGVVIGWAGVVVGGRVGGWVVGAKVVSIWLWGL